jgi:hypothetical protein
MHHVIDEALIISHKFLGHAPFDERLLSFPELIVNT